MASARSLYDGLTTSDVPHLRTNNLDKGRGRANRVKNTTNSGDTADEKGATDKQENESISPAAVIENSTDSASKAESNILDLLKKMCATNADEIKALKPEDESIIVEKVLENISTGEDLQNLVSDIYDWTLLDPALTSCVASLCAALAKFEKDGVIFRLTILNHIREGLESRDSWRGDQPTRWLAFVCLLCDLFAMMKTAANGYLNILIEPVYSCLEQLVTDKNGSEKQIEYATLKLKQLGQILQRSHPAKMEILMDSLRDRFLGTGVTVNSRVHLLETIELCASGWAFDDSTTSAYVQLYQDTMKGN
ncbi:MIF4G domain-containing protein B-like [Asterias amurensis]|uniref:MIF4G domain-containing protein B-like n=1 Tax=Asterias amurensis TaxID=7602 RepID=UPI003AB1E2F6